MLNTTAILTFIYCIVDDIVNMHPKHPKPGVNPSFTDSELIALVLYKELAGIESERQLIRFIKRDYLFLFPELVDQSQFNRRARELAWLIEDIRQNLLIKLGAYLVELAVIDSTAVPIKHVVRAAITKSERDDLIDFGKRFAHKETYYGMKLHLLINRYGVPVTCILTSPKVFDGRMTDQLLQDRTNIVVLGDKAYIDDELREKLLCDQSIILVVPTRANQKHQNNQTENYALRKGRLLIESIFNMLKDHLKLDKILAKTKQGFLVRIHRKITAFVLGIYMNLLLDRPGLAVKSLAA